MGRKLGAPRKLQFGGLTLFVKVTYESWGEFQDAMFKMEELEGLVRIKAGETAIREFCERSVVDWKGATDEENKDLAYSPELLSQMFDPHEIGALQDRIASAPPELLPNP